MNFYCFTNFTNSTRLTRLIKIDKIDSIETKEKGDADGAAKNGLMRPAIPELMLVDDYCYA